jgi:hypothetical protein
MCLFLSLSKPLLFAVWAAMPMARNREKSNKTAGFAGAG